MGRWESLSQRAARAVHVVGGQVWQELMGAKYKTHVAKASHDHWHVARHLTRAAKALAAESWSGHPDFDWNVSDESSVSSDGSSFSKDKSNASETSSVKGSDSSDSVGCRRHSTRRRSRHARSRLARTQGSAGFLSKKKKEGGREERSSSHVDQKRKSRWWLWLFLQRVEEDSRTDRTREFSRVKVARGDSSCLVILFCSFFHFERLVILSIQS